MKRVLGVPEGYPKWAWKTDPPPKPVLVAAERSQQKLLPPEYPAIMKKWPNQYACTRCTRRLYMSRALTIAEKWCRKNGCEGYLAEVHK